MIQEKDFLYRVPVKNALVTAPGKQVRNPEILVDLEGGEFMHGDILDANSTNKLIDQSVKDAIDNSIENGNYVTKDLLEAETSARTKSDEDLSAKIKAEQTRAEGKEKQISDKLAIVDGDSNTEGSFRKAIADVIAAAPEDLDTLKEIADKLAGNDDLYTALNQVITEKADASALANEVSRATGVENDLRTAIGTKADATALSNYVLTTALNQQVDTLNAAISAKQDAGNYVTKDLLEAETSARTKSDEDLSAKIKAEQTRAEGKEKQISDKLAIVDGDSNTEGSFRKAIADVIAAAPEDLDTLKEIADKLAGNDDLYTALNQVITEKADASALANEVSRATGVENDLRTAIGTKADATALSNYVLTTALNQQVDTLNAAISAKQDAGNYVPYTQQSGGGYEMEIGFVYNYTTPGDAPIQTLIGGDISMQKNDGPRTYITAGSISVGYPMLKDNSIDIIPESVTGRINGILSFELNENGVLLNGGDNNHVLTSNASTIDITQYALKTELPTVPTNVSQLTNDSNFITQQDADARYALANSLNTVNDSTSSLRVGLSKKQDKITVNSVDITDIETADITKLRTIVRNLIDALNTSGLIRTNSNLE